MMPRKKILVTPETSFIEHRILFAMLGSSYPIDFIGGTLDAFPACDGVIAWIKSYDEIHHLEARGVDSIAIIVTAHEPGAVVNVPNGQVAFASSPQLDRCFQACVMCEQSVTEFRPLSPEDRDEIIGSLDAQPCWTSRALARGQLTLLALAPPAILAGDTLYRHFNRLTWLRLLPLLHFAKRLTHEQDWSPPPLRACLMFDDPNLHWSTYGFIDFKKFARHAADCHYHAAFAMIPVDAWYFNDKTAQLFRTHPDRLSLLIHGNDHEGAEFGLERPTAHFERMLGQGLRRIERFEQRSGLSVARVMAPPYGAFSVTAANAMLHLGYEALCVSRASITNWNKSAAWPSGFGHNIVEFIGDGLPLIPRHVLAANQADTYRLAAFLDQPIIPHGHHQDCAHGLDGLARAAEQINRLGNIHWCDLRTLSRSNYQTRREGDTLFVRMLAHQITLPSFEPGVCKIVVVRPWITTDRNQEETLICHQIGAVQNDNRELHQSQAIEINPLHPVYLRSIPRLTLDPHAIAPPARRLWPVIRRVLSEGRDRVVPILPGRSRRPA